MAADTKESLTLTAFFAIPNDSNQVYESMRPSKLIEVIQDIKYGSHSHTT